MLHLTPQKSGKLVMNLECPSCRFEDATLDATDMCDDFSDLDLDSGRKHYSYHSDTHITACIYACLVENFPQSALIMMKNAAKCTSSKM